MDKNLLNQKENSHLKYRRKGPLWQSRFKSVRIKNNEQLLHVSRYIHLNPVTNYLVNDPKDWELSSYGNYLDDRVFKKIYDISIPNPREYDHFVRNQIDYQRKLKIIKKLIFE